MFVVTRTLPPLLVQLRPPSYCHSHTQTHPALICADLTVPCAPAFPRPHAQSRGGGGGSVALTDPSIERILDRSASMSLFSPHRAGGTISGGGGDRTYNSFAGLQDMVSMVDEMVATAPTSPKPLGAFGGAGLGRTAGRLGLGGGAGSSIGGGASKGVCAEARKGPLGQAWLAAIRPERAWRGPYPCTPCAICRVGRGLVVRRPQVARHWAAALQPLRRLRLALTALTAAEEPRPGRRTCAGRVARQQGRLVAAGAAAGPTWERPRGAL